MEDVRIVAKGRIKDLSKGFRLPESLPFSIYLRSKTGVVENDTLIQCRLICDKEIGDFPVPVGDWTPAMIVSIAPDAIDLNNYEVYWGASEQPSKIS